MSLNIHIKNLIHSTAESQLISIRLPSTTVNAIDELAAEVGALRSDLIVSFIDGGLEELDNQLLKTREVEIISEIENPEPVNSDVRYFMLNTNYGHVEADHYTMLENGEASAFYKGWKENIDYLRDGDCVFLYQSGYGICAYGFADKILIKRPHGDHDEAGDECHSRKLNDFKRIKKPITAKHCKDATKSNLNFRKTMVRLTKAQGEALIAVINQNL